ncbi:MAG: long-chain acyl-CoA synthetase [Pseudonocardiales bacterium]|nr:long-chain acyl-CoA synthetase [Pseudonocardiales bacterium]
MDSSQDPTPPTHLADLVAAAAAAQPDHPAMVDAASPTESTLTWAEFDAAGSAEARRLIAAGAVAGDRVAIRSSGGALLAVAVLGALRAGAVAVPLGPGDGPRDAVVVAHCTPRLLVDAGPVGAAPDDGGGGAPAGVTVLGPPDLDARGEALPAVGGGEDLALLSYTAGAHGVCLSHRALRANRAQAAALRPAPITPVDRVLLAQPLFPAYGLAAGLFQVWWAGATAVLPGPGRPDAGWLVDAVARHRVSALTTGPATYRALLELPADRLRTGLAGLRLCTCGGAPLPARWAAAFRDATGHRIVEGYGLTEAGPVVTSTPIDGAAGAGSVGRPLPGIELRVVELTGGPPTASGPVTDAEEAAAAADRGRAVADMRAVASRAASEVRAAAGRGAREVRAAAGRAATEVRAAVRAVGPAGDPVGDMIDDAQDVEGPPAGDAGLIAVRGPNLFSGYWPDRTGGPDADGWFRTPDLGFLDASGDLYLVDRSSDLVVVSGFTVYPHEIELVLAELDGVVEAAVVGVPDERTGHAVRAVVVSGSGAGGSGAGELSADAVRDHCRSRLARFKVPTQVVFVDELPRTPTGRLLRGRLVEQSPSEAPREDVS